MDPRYLVHMIFRFIVLELIQGFYKTAAASQLNTVYVYEHCWHEIYVTEPVSRGSFQRFCFVETPIWVMLHEDSDPTDLYPLDCIFTMSPHTCLYLIISLIELKKNEFLAIEPDGVLCFIWVMCFMKRCKFSRVESWETYAGNLRTFPLQNVVKSCVSVVLISLNVASDPAISLYNLVTFHVSCLDGCLSIILSIQSITSLALHESVGNYMHK